MGSNRFKTMAALGWFWLGLGVLTAVAAETQKNSPNDDMEAFRKDLEGKLSQIRENELRVRLGAFGDLHYRVLGNAGSFPSQNDFAMGDAALAVKGQYGDHIRFIDENVIEFEGEDAKLSVDRLLVSYTVGDELRIAGGRDHTAYGHWNRTHNYAAQLQTTIHRPFFLAFEDDGGVVPSHMTGLTADGTFDLGGSALKYELNLGNSDNILLTGSGGSIAEAKLGNNPGGDSTSGKSVVGRLVFKPWSDGGLTLGIAADWNRYDVAATPDLIANPAMGPFLFSGLGQIVFEGEAIYTDDHFDFLFEFYDFDDQVAGMPISGSADNMAFYAQTDYRVTENLLPYLRVESLKVDGSDPFFRALQKNNKALYLAGCRLEIVPKISCLKLEGSLTRESDSPDAVEIASQWAFGF